MSQEEQLYETLTDYTLENIELRRVPWALRRGDCWCEMAIGNPMVRSHDQSCLDAKAIFQGRSGGGRTP